MGSMAFCISGGKQYRQQRTAFWVGLCICRQHCAVNGINVRKIIRCLLLPQFAVRQLSSCTKSPRKREFQFTPPHRGHPGESALPPGALCFNSRPRTGGITASCICSVAVHGFKLATPISNGGLTLTPPGYFSGSARGGISQYHFYWLPPKEGSPTFFRPPACRSLPVPEYISKSFLRLHSLLSKHSILAPRNACLPILSGTPAACQKASAYSSLSDMT